MRFVLLAVLGSGLVLWAGCGHRRGASQQARALDAASAPALVADARPQPVPRVAGALADAGAHDAGGPAEGQRVATTPAGQRPIAWGRLVVTLPPGFDRRPHDQGPPSDPAEVAAEDCWYRVRDERFELGLCATPTFGRADDLEWLARAFLAHQVPDREPGMVPVAASGASPALRMFQVRPAGEIASVSEYGELLLGALLFVAHPDGTALRLEVFYDAPERHAEALVLADQVVSTLGPGPVTVTRAAGRRTLRFGGGLGSLSLDVPEGFLAVWGEGMDSWGLDLARPARLGDPSPTIGVWFHNAIGIEEPYDEFPGRRPAKVFGREVTFHSRTEHGVEHLAWDEPVPELDATLYLSAEGLPGPELDQLVASLGSAELRVNRAAIEESDVDASQLRTTCGFFVVDPSSPLNVRAAANGDAPVLGSLPDGTRVEVAEQRGGWLRLSSPLAGWAWAGSVRRQCVDR